MANTLIPVYSSRGDPEAFLAYPYLFNRNGEWIGFLTPQREVYSVLGCYVGSLTNDPRIVAKRSGESKPRLKPPQAPPRIQVPAMTPLPKLMADLSYETIDVLLDEPERLHTLDAGELRQDLD
jgi:hypothetical protein